MDTQARKQPMEMMEMWNVALLVLRFGPGKPGKPIPETRYGMRHDNCKDEGRGPKGQKPKWQQSTRWR